MSERCILYVEDDKHEALLTEYAFKKAGITHRLHIVADGRQAIDYLAGLRNGDGEMMGPCLVLLDLHLPGMSGLEVLRWIRAHPALNSLVVVMLTSSQDPKHIALAYQLKVNSFINKPSNFDKQQEFARLLKAWWLDLNQLPETNSLDGQQMEFADFATLRRDGLKPTPRLAAFVSPLLAEHSPAH